MDTRTEIGDEQELGRTVRVKIQGQQIASDGYPLTIILRFGQGSASLNLRRPFLISRVQRIYIDALLLKILSIDRDPASGFLARSGNLFTHVTRRVCVKVEDISQCLLLLKRNIFKEIFQRLCLRDQHFPIQLVGAGAEGSANAKAQSSQNESNARQHRSRIADEEACVFHVLTIIPSARDVL